MESKQPLGRVVHLDDRKLVFVGKVDDRDAFYIGFRNSNDEATRLVLSPEAFDALVWLHAHWDDLPLKETFPSARHDKMVWRVVEPNT